MPQSFGSFYIITKPLVFQYIRGNFSPPKGLAENYTFLKREKYCLFHQKEKKEWQYLSLAKMQKLKQTLFVQKSIEYFLENILEIVFHSM